LSGNSATCTTSGLDAGNHTVSAEYAGATAAPGFRGSTGTLAHFVSTKTLTITADNASKTYGTTLTFGGTEFTVTGLSGSDSVTSVTLASTGAAATASVAGSPYAIVPSAAVGTGLSNYSINYVNGALTVGKKALTVKADDKSTTYGTAPTFTVSVSVW
jgi:hypothetical protein